MDDDGSGWLLLFGPPGFIIRKDTAGDMDIDRVEWYAGYRGQEKPRAVWVDGQRIEVEEIIWQKRIRSAKSGQTREVFLCRLAGGGQVRIVKSVESEGG